MTRYLIPRGLISGPAAARAVEAGVALPLAGGPLAFATVEAIERAAGEEGHRRPVALAEARAFAPDLVEGLARPRPHWAGFDLKRPLIMGVVNVTPDSFSDGGDFAEASHAIDHAPGHAGGRRRHRRRGRRIHAARRAAGAAGGRGGARPAGGAGARPCRRDGLDRHAPRGGDGPGGGGGRLDHQRRHRA